MTFDIQGHYETKEGHTGDKSFESGQQKITLYRVSLSAVA